ncbi:hypothetical protein [Sulfitobacter aestuariivivens]|uniref:Uncharacterized protein n=1 Tax=Sulfitobacter aestuariivivens TaxID=2766981 RepID=A0A927HE61_9RHOB|nr:hypothetical protein [Sulfitobacter aestuariivivens]MBD3663551.1 hypothetical protein [Sulfitobacter aestuariivivens]
MPTEFYIIAGVCFAVMALSAFYLGDENKTTRAFARVGIVTGGSFLFVATMYFGAILIAVLIVMLPVCLFLAWWGEIF